MSDAGDAYELEDSQAGRPIICQHCGAKQIGLAIACWLCKESLATPVARESEAEESALPYPDQGLSFSLATLFLIITLASVCMGLLVAAPGLGVFACIIMVPVFFRTMRVVRHRERMGESISPLQKVMMFSTSFALSSVLVIVVCVSAFCSFCGVCLAVVAVGGSAGGDFVPWAVGLSFGAVASIAVAVQMIRWMRRRYRRDLGEE